MINNQINPNLNFCSKNHHILSDKNIFTQSLFLLLRLSSYISAAFSLSAANTDNHVSSIAVWLVSARFEPHPSSSASQTQITSPHFNPRSLSNKLKLIHFSSSAAAGRLSIRQYMNLHVYIYKKKLKSGKKENKSREETNSASFSASVH